MWWGQGEVEQGGARGVEWVTLTHGREILECSGGRDMSDQVWLLFGRSFANTPSFLAPCIDPIFLTRLHLPSVHSLSKCCAVSSWYGGYLCVWASSSGYIARSTRFGFYLDAVLQSLNPFLSPHNPRSNISYDSAPITCVWIFEWMLHRQLLIWRLSLWLCLFKRNLDLWEGSEWYFQWR